MRSTMLLILTVMIGSVLSILVLKAQGMGGAGLMH
jgi:hypothetical protein